jgi:integrase
MNGKATIKLRVPSTDADDRHMVRAELMGGHSHLTLVGTRIHIWRRGDRFLARERYQGRRFGETLGDRVPEATARLRQILTDIENGAYRRPSEARRRMIASGVVRRLTVRQLVDEFLVEKRQVRGQQTAADYRSRLNAVLAFAELPDHKRRWPLALDIDRDFVRTLRMHLFQVRTTRNGRAGAQPKSLSSRQVLNVLECLRTVLAWANNPAVQKLPAGWANPVTHDLIGSMPGKDPLRDDKLPLAERVRLVNVMDHWQLCHLGLSLILPLRPDEAVGLLVGDVNFERGWLEFGHRFPDSNFNKGRVAFRLPFPAEVIPLLRVCIGGRAEGPLLRNRHAFAKDEGNVPSTDDLQRRYQDTLLGQPADMVQTPQDRKRVFRRLLRQLGGVSTDALSNEFKKLLVAVGIDNGATFYTLRSSVTTAMKNANLPHLEMRYLTSHSTNDILNDYATLDPIGAMRSYFVQIQPLLDAIATRAAAYHLTDRLPS